MHAYKKILIVLAASLAMSAVAQGQSLLFEDDFDDGVIDTSLWEVWLPFENSSVAETGGVLRIENRGWLLSSPTLAGLDQDLILEGEFSPEIQSGSYADSWRFMVYANNAPSASPYENTDGLYGGWWGQSSNLAIAGTGNIQASVSEGVAAGGDWKGFRLSTIRGVATVEMWDLSNPNDAVQYQTSFTKLPGAGERIIFLNREAIGFNHVTLLDNVRVYLNEDCNGNGLPDSQDIAADVSLDCDGNGSLDSCEISDDPSLDQNANGVLDTCECVAINYCLAAGNSAGTNATIGYQGSLSTSRNDLALTVVGAPPLKIGLFFYGDGRNQKLFGEGLLCVSAPVQRMQRLLLTDEIGAASLQTDFTQPPLNGGPFSIDPFSSWNFQFWYRDPLGGPSGFNLSDGLEVTFCP